MRILLSAALLLGLAACATPQLGGATSSPALLSALDSQKDGFVGATETGARFEIQSTAVSDQWLCRVVTIDTSDSFEVESFCKAPGGTWR